MAVTDRHKQRLQGLNWQKLFSHSSGGLRSEVKGCALSGRFFPCLFWLPGAARFLGLWPHHSSLCPLPSHGLPLGRSSLPFSSKDTTDCRVRSNPGRSHLKLLNLITYAKSLFPIRSHPTVGRRQGGLCNRGHLDFAGVQGLLHN